ncbi:MAG TPA: DUF885 family protein [Aliidongia sp.]|nr:DUF885 family protein [Aliidongia sp.]
MIKMMLATMALLAMAPTVALAAGENPQLKHLIEDFESFRRFDDPLQYASENPSAPLTLPDVTPAADAQRKTMLDALQKRLGQIDRAKLAAADQVNHAFLARLIADQLESLRFDESRFPFVADSGFHTTLGYLVGSARIGKRADAEGWLALLESVPKYYADNIANARRGLATGFIQPKSVVEGVLAVARGQASLPVEGDPLLTPLATLPDTIPLVDQKALRAQALALVAGPVRAAQHEFVRFLEADYLPKARTSLGASEMPQGRDYYAWLVRRHTTTDMTPDEVFATGEAEVARIRAEMDGVIKETGFEGSFAEFLAFLRKDPRFYATTRQSLLEKVSEIAKRIDDQLPRHFGTLPRLTYGVRPVPAAIEENYTSGRYFEGSPQRGIAGGLMINTSHLDQRPLFEMPALALHEGVPGHHLQIALAQELDIPAFRRSADMTAYVEGWALYSERLGLEMGIYRDAYERFGRLSFEMWRACRLVIDTGIHWKGWTIEQARACFTDNTALSERNIESELQRYIAWPGQALAYKIGEIRIVALRKRAEQTLGEHFDERRFHDALLLAGPLPLDLLESRIDGWIEAEKRAARPG